MPDLRVACAIEDCGKDADKRGWCGMHYRRWQRHGDPLYQRPVRTHKQCKECRALLPLADFYRNKRRKSYASRCRRCFLAHKEKYRQTRLTADLAAKRRWYERNAALVRQRMREQYWSDPDKARAEKRADHQKHRERRNAATRERLLNDPAALAALREAQRRNTRKRRVAARGVVVGRVTKQGWAAKVAFWGDRCWQCEGEWDEIDHVKPISRGGAHMLCNLRPICGPCNKAKSARWPIEVSTRRAA